MTTTNTQKQVTGVFETYQKARVAFVQSVADLAQNPKNIDALQKCGIMALLRPLLLDTVPSIQHNAAQALGRLANYNPELATAVVNGDILPQLVNSLADAEQNVRCDLRDQMVIICCFKVLEKLVTYL
jgi:hypothetical protein